MKNNLPNKKFVTNQDFLEGNCFDVSLQNWFILNDIKTSDKLIERIKSSPYRASDGGVLFGIQKNHIEYITNNKFTCNIYHSVAEGAAYDAKAMQDIQKFIVNSGIYDHSNAGFLAKAVIEEVNSDSYRYGFDLIESYALNPRDNGTLLNIKTRSPSEEVDIVKKMVETDLANSPNTQQEDLKLIANLLENNRSALEETFKDANNSPENSGFHSVLYLNPSKFIPGSYIDTDGIIYNEDKTGELGVISALEIYKK